MFGSDFDSAVVGARLFRLDPGVYFFAVYSDIFRRVDADSDLVATNAEHGNVNLVPDGDGFADAAGQNQHANSPSLVPKTKGNKHTRRWGLRREL
jgi:hypothetical protein